MQMRILLLLVALSMGVSAQTSNGQRELSRGAFVPAIDTNNKDQVARLYRDFFYWPGDYVGAGPFVPSTFPIASAWTGNTSQCIAGDISMAVKQAAIRQINFYRVLAGVSPVRMADAAGHQLAQEAALVVGANAYLTHNPPPTSRCYSQMAAAGARQSNLGYTFRNESTPAGFYGYMDDYGAGNERVGHRRTLIASPFRRMAFGTTLFEFPNYPPPLSGADAIWLDYALATRFVNPTFSAWPPPGWVPQLAMPWVSNRWSLACNGCRHTNSTVSMMRDGVALPPAVVIVRNDPVDPEILVWEPPGVEMGFESREDIVPISRDSAYTVTVSNVGVPTCPDVLTRQCTVFAPRTFTYTVRVFDANKYLKSAQNVPAHVVDGEWSAGDSRGHTLHVAQLGTGDVAVTVRLRDSTGQPVWYMMPAARWSSPTVLTGTLQVYAGASLTGTSAASPSVVAASSATLTFTGENAASLSYSVNGQATVVPITRGAASAPQVITDGRNFSGLWSSDTNGSVAMTIAQEYDTLTANVLYFSGGASRFLATRRCEWSDGDTCFSLLGDSVTRDGITSFKARGSVRLTFLDDYSVSATVSFAGQPSVTTVLQRRTSAPFGQGVQASLPVPTAQSNATQKRLPFNNLSGIISGVVGNKGEANVIDDDGMVFRMANGNQ
jgi:hypothetical protein